MKQSCKSNCFIRLAPLALLLALAAPLSAQAGKNAAAEWPARISGEFAFYRDYTFKDPAWTGILFYDESTWAAQVFFPESKKRVAAFFSTESKGGSLILTGQRNDPNLQPEDVPHVNYLMQILPLLWEARQGAEASSAGMRANAQSPFPPGASMRKESALFGGMSEFVFSPEIPVFALSRVRDSAGRTVFAFESAGVIGQGNSDAFFNFEPVPQEARRKLAETRRAEAARQRADSPRRQGAGAGASEEIVAVAPNFFLVGNTASVVTGGGETGGLSSEALYALAAKNFLLSVDPSVLPIPGTFAWTAASGGIWLDQILYMKDEKELMRKRMLIRAGFPAGRYSFAEVSCFESSFAQNKAHLERVAASLLSSE